MKLAFKIVTFLFIFFLLSCKKDKKDTQPPSISYTSPQNGQVYHMFDTITVTARVSDNEHLSSIYVVLTDMNHTPVQGISTIAVTSADFTISTRYILSEYRLQSGSYLMQITADDGYNSTSSFQSVYIIESPTKWLGYCVNTKLNPQNIVRYDSTKTINFSIPVTGPYNGMKYGGYFQQLYVNGNATQPFQAYDLPNNAIAYTEGLIANQTNYTCLYTDGYKSYVGFYNGNIYSFTSTGTPGTTYRYTGQNASYPYYFTTTSLYGVAAFKNTTAPGSDNMVTFSNFGATYNNSFFPVYLKSIIGIFEISADSFYVFGNDANNQAVACIYQPLENSFSGSPIGNIASTMLSAIKINSRQVIFSASTGVYTCNNLNINTAALLPYAAQKLVYQPKLNILTAATMGNLNAYTVNANSLSPVITAHSLSIPGDSIIDFEVITNK